MELVHKSPFVGAASRIVDIDGGFALLGVLKATFSIGHAGQIQIAEEQRPVTVSDEWFSEPGHSSVLNENDGAYYKPRTDVIATGETIAPGGNPVSECLCHLRVGRVKKTVRVIGDRRWFASGLGASWTPPAKFTRLPLCWERAFGGRDLSVSPDDGQWDPRNPVGPGFCSRGNPSVLDGIALPNFEAPGHEISGWRDHPDLPVPQGLGFIGRGWDARARHAGTYDEHWRKTRMPVLPLDFDALFFNAATEDLLYPGYLQGGELVEAVNLSSRGTDRFLLPCVQVTFESVGFGQRQRVAAFLDTVVFTLSEDRFTMVWRARIKIKHNEPEEPVLAHVVYR